jgi:RNA polymerase primary sigma factor
MIFWDDIDADPDREGMLLALLGAIVGSSMMPLSERDLVAGACNLLTMAWADYEPGELRRLLRGDSPPPGVIVTAVGLFAAKTPPVDIAVVFERSVRAEMLAAAVADMEGQPGVGEAVPGLFGRPLLSADAERRLGREARRGDYGAIRSMVMSNTRLAAGLARRKFGYPALDHEDFFQEATLGLLRAAEKFDPHKGFRFSTYATWWIRQAVARAIADKSRTVRVPVHIAEKLNQLRAIERRYYNEGRDPPTDTEILLETNWSANDLVALRQAEILPEPLDAHVNFANPADVSVEDEAIAVIELWELDTFLQKHLTDRERDVLDRRLGLFGHDKETLDQIGIHYNLTRERIRQIENQAMKKLLESDEAKARREDAKSPSATEYARSKPACNLQGQNRGSSTARPGAKVPQAPFRSKSQDVTPSYRGADTPGDVSRSSTTSEQHGSDGRVDSPEQRERDRVIAARATMLLCDPGTGRPETTLGRRHIEMLRETLTRWSEQASAGAPASLDLTAIRAIARGEAEPTREQQELLDAIERAFCDAAAAPTVESWSASPLGTRVMAAMIHAIDDVGSGL